jgi:hypothetical protein
MTDDIKPVQIYSVIWEECWERELCVKIPWDGKKCTDPVGACLRIIEESGTYYIELALLGESIRYELASLCYPAYSIGIATFSICTNDLAINGENISFNLIAKLCIGAFGFEECWELAKKPIVIRFFTTAQLGDLLGKQTISIKGDGIYLSVATDDEGIISIKSIK